MITAAPQPRCFEHRQAESLVPRGEREERSPPVQRTQRAVGHVSGEHDVVAGEAPVEGVTAPLVGRLGSDRADDHQLMVAADAAGQESEGVDERLRILAGVVSRDAHDERALQRRHRGSEDLVGVVAGLLGAEERRGRPTDDGYTRGVDAENVHCVAGCALGDREDEVGGADEPCPAAQELP